MATTDLSSAHSRKVMAFLALIIAAIFWGGSFLVIQETMTHDIWMMLAVRHLIGAVGAFIIFRGKVFKVEKKDCKLYGIIAFWIAVSFAPQAIGLQGTSVANSAVITSLFVVLTPLLMFWMNRGKPSLFQWLGSIVGISAFGVLGYSQGFSTLSYFDLLTFLTAIAVAFHTIYFSDVVKDAHKLASIVFYQFFLSALLLFVIAFAVGQNQGALMLQAFTGKEILGLLYLGLFSMAVPYALQGFAQRTVSPVQVVLVISSEPFWALAIANMMRGDPISGAALLASALLLLANGVAELKFKRS